jgi:hydrogenase nickel incorporation protein HypA/HybF
MHEYSLTCSILEILEKIIEEKKLKRIKKINFELNRLAGIEPESIKFYFDFLAKDNACLHGAKLHFKKTGTRIKCSDCNKIYNIKSFEIKCPKCSGINVKIMETDDIKIVSLETD